MKKTTNKWKWSIPFLMLLAGLLLVPIGIFQPDFSQIPGDFADARFNNFVLEHGHQYISGKTTNYWDAPFMYPYPNSIAFSDNLLGTLPIYSLFRAFSLDRETAFQFWILSLFILNFICCFYVLHKWGNNMILASCGGYIFAFSLLLVGNIYNVQTLPRFIVPFVFYWAWQFLHFKKNKHLVALGIGIVYQFYCGVYLGFFTLYGLLFFMIMHFLVYGSKVYFKELFTIKKVGSMLSVIIFCGLLMLPLMLPYIEHADSHGYRKFQDIIDTIPTPSSYFFTSGEAITWNVLSHHFKYEQPLWYCHFLFLGAIPWLCVIAAPFILFIKKVNIQQKKAIGVLWGSVLLSLLFSTQVEGSTLYRYIFELPGFSSMRSINRIINTEVILFVFLLVFVIKALLTISPKFKYLVWALPILIVADNLIDPSKIKHFDKAESIKRIEAVKEQVKLEHTKEHTAIAYFPPAENSMPYSHLDAMLVAQELRIACVNAYSGSLPPGLYAFARNPNEESLKKWCKANNMDRTTINAISLPLNK